MSVRLQVPCAKVSLANTSLINDVASSFFVKSVFFCTLCRKQESEDTQRFETGTTDTYPLESYVRLPDHHTSVAFISENSRPLYLRSRGRESDRGKDSQCDERKESVLHRVLVKIRVACLVKAQA